MSSRDYGGRAWAPPTGRDVGKGGWSDSGGTAGRRPGEGGFEAGGVGVAALLRRGRTLEDLGCDSEALLVYEEALALPEAERSPFDTGRLMHRVGGCALATGDGPRAFASHVDAARRARDLGMRRHCGEWLAAAGWGLAAHPIARSVADVIDRDLVGAAFDGVLDEVREVLLADGAPRYEHAMILHARFAGLTILSAESLQDEAPSSAAEALYHDVVVPFRALHDVPRRATVDEAVLVAFVMGALARLCRALAEQARQHCVGTPPAEEAVAAMAGLMADAFVRDLGDPLLLWLGTYLGDRRGAAWAWCHHLSTTARNRRAS